MTKNNDKINVRKEERDVNEFVAPTCSKLSNNWTSVDERLPNHQDDLLVLVDRYMVVMNYYIEEKEWSCSGNYPTNITHWMELPEPPETHRI